MCWNSDISLNTFIFGIFALLFIYITNTYSKYKSHTFDNPIIYLFILEVLSIQLLEFFLWKNLKNVYINKLISTIMGCIIITQPATLILMIDNINIKKILFLLYILFGFIVLLYKSNPINFHTTVGKDGHLIWEWLNHKGYANILLAIGLLFYVIPLIYINNSLLILFVFTSLLISLIFYFKYKTFGSMWCWLSNTFLLYVIIDILIIKPFIEYNGLC